MNTNTLDSIMEEVIAQQWKEWAKEGLSDETIEERLTAMDWGYVTYGMIKQACADYETFFKENMEKITKKEEKEFKRFAGVQQKCWGKCFSASRVMYTIALESAEDYSKMLSQMKDDEQLKGQECTLYVLQYMQARACQEFLEILLLIRNGFADGAYARWRSMYELCCNAEFIVKYGEKVAKKYYVQSLTDERSYLWAKGVIGKDGKEIKRPSFAAIQRNIDIASEWEKQYDLACFINHGSPQGTFGRMSIKEETKVLAVGQSNYGIAMPAVQSAISLCRITILFICQIPTMESVSKAMLLQRWVDYIRTLYEETNNKLFKDEQE